MTSANAAELRVVAVLTDEVTAPLEALRKRIADLAEAAKASFAGVDSQVSTLGSTTASASTEGGEAIRRLSDDVRSLGEALRASRADADASLGKLSGEVRSVATEMQATSARTRETAAALADLTAKGAAPASAEVHKLTSEVDALRAQLERLRARNVELEDLGRSTTKTTGIFSKLREITSRLFSSSDIAGVSEVGRGLETAETAAEGLAGGVNLSGGALLGLAAGAAVVIGLGVALASATAESARLEQSLAPIVVRSREMRAGFDDVKTAVRELAAETGVARDAIAAGLVATTNVGIEGQRQAIEFTKAATEASLVGLGTVEQSAERIGRVVKEFGLDSADARDVVANLFVAAKRGGAEFGGFADALARSGAQARALRIPYEDLAAVLAAVTKQGLSVQEGGASISQVLARLGNAQDTSHRKLEALGVDLSEAAIAGKGLSGVLADIIEKVNAQAATQGERDNLFLEIFGSPRVSKAITAAVQDSGKTVSEVFVDMRHSGEQLGEALDARLNLPSERLARTWANLKDTGATLGDALLKGAAAVAGTDAPQTFARQVESRFPDPIEFTRFRDEAEKALREGRPEIAAKIAADFEEIVRRASETVRTSRLSKEFLDLKDASRLSEADRFPSTLAGLAAVPEVAKKLALPAGGEGLGGGASVDELRAAFLASRDAVELLNEKIREIPTGLRAIDPATGALANVEKFARDAKGAIVAVFSEIRQPVPLTLTPEVPKDKIAREIDRALSEVRGTFVLEDPFANFPAAVQRARALLDSLRAKPSLLFNEQDTANFQEATKTITDFAKAQKDGAALLLSIRAKDAEAQDAQLARDTAQEERIAAQIEEYRKLGAAQDLLVALERELGDLRAKNAQSRTDRGLVDDFRNLITIAGQAKDDVLADFRQLITASDEARRSVGEVRRVGDTLASLSDQVDSFAAGAESNAARAVSELDRRLSALRRRLEDLRVTPSIQGDEGEAIRKQIDDLIERLGSVEIEAHVALDTKQAEARLEFLGRGISDLRSLASEALPVGARELGAQTADVADSAERARAAFVAQARALGVSRDEAEQLADRIKQATISASQTRSREVAFDVALRPSFQIEDEALRQELFDRSKPLIDAYRASVAGALADGVITTEEAARVRADLRSMQDGVSELRVEVENADGSFQTGFFSTLRDKSRAAFSAFRDGASLASSTFDSFGNDFGGAIADFATHAKTGKEAMHEFTSSLIADIARASAKLLAFRALSSILSLFGGGPSLAPVGAGNAPTSVFGLPQGSPVAAIGGVASGHLVGSAPTRRPTLSESLGAPHLPARAYALGGVASTPQVGIFGEGGAEAFVPLPGPNRGIPVEFRPLPAALRERSPGGETAGAIEMHINFAPVISALDGAGAATVLRREARELGRIIASELTGRSNRDLHSAVVSVAARARG